MSLGHFNEHSTFLFFRDSTAEIPVARDMKLERLEGYFLSSITETANPFPATIDHEFSFLSLPLI